MTRQFFEIFIFWCGFGHVILCLGSLAVPKALQWSEGLKNIRPLLRQMFWTYAAYILAINLSFGIISMFGAQELLNHSFLAGFLTIFIAIYWLARILIQFFYFDRHDAPKGMIYNLGEGALIMLFIVFTATYFAAFLFNAGWI